MSQRLDKWLCYARFVKHRAKAQDLIAAGHVRVNGKRAEKASATIKPADVLTLVLPDNVRVVEVLAEPERRGPASSVQMLYRNISSPTKTGCNRFSALLEPEHVQIIEASK